MNETNVSVTVTAPVDILTPTPTPTPILEFTGDYAFLSNFYGGPIGYDGLDYRTVEHAYHAAKTVNLSDRLAIQASITASQARAYGRSSAIRIRPDWDEVRVGIMAELLAVKFDMPRLAKMLTATGTRPLIHGSWYRYPGLTFWGAKLTGRPGEPENVTWEGENTLGLLLEALRAVLI